MTEGPVPDPVAVRDQLRQCLRRVHTYLHCLLPGDDVRAAIGEAAGRINREPERAPGAIATMLLGLALLARRARSRR